MEQTVFFIKSDPVFGKRIAKSPVSFLRFRVFVRPGNKMKYTCIMLMDQVLHQFLHYRIIIDTDIQKLFMVPAFKDHCRDPRSLHIINDLFPDLRIRKRI